ncbi:hypothetical protein CKA32_006866 [Geitlerinema sp. FC II]|nr:hypothetical protein CKA32_006866 [Geitlerinema sp. FC II]
MRSKYDFSLKLIFVMNFKLSDRHSVKSYRVRHSAKLNTLVAIYV